MYLFDFLTRDLISLMKLVVGHVISGELWESELSGLGNCDNYGLGITELLVSSIYMQACVYVYI